MEDALARLAEKGHYGRGVDRPLGRRAREPIGEQHVNVIVGIRSRTY